MENSSVSVRENNQVKGEKPPPQICPRCYSDNTRFCYYNNKSLSQPRYTCKNCRRLWTHGGTLRDIPVGGIGRKTKPQTIDQPSVAQVVPVETQQVNHHQPFLHGQETNDFVGSIGGSSSSSTADAAVGNHFGSFPANHGDMVFPDFNDRYRINQEEPNRPRQSFNNTKSKNRNASTRGRRG